MTTQSPVVRTKDRAINPEWTLAVLALLTFLLIPIQVNTIYSGLPAHPLFLHVPVILIPVAAVGALALVAVPRLFARHGLWIGLVAVAALGATNLTVGAGKALQRDLHLQGPGIVARHAGAADRLRAVFILFTALLLIAVAVFRTAGPRVTGIGIVDEALTAVRSRPALGAAVRAIVAVMAIVSVYYVIHTGDLGAKAVWRHRLGGGLPGGGIGSLFPGGGAAPGGGG